MLLDFFYELRRRKVPVASQEWLALMRALALGLHESSLDGFYHLSRAILVKDVALFDAFDDAFLVTFKGVAADSLSLVEDLMKWLEDPKKLEQLTEEQKRMIQMLEIKELRELFEKRLAEQKKRHEGGNKWIGTGGTSPFGQGGKHPTGMSVGGGGQKTAMQVAEERRYRAYRKDVLLDVRKIDVVLRTLRDLGREGAPSELDLDDTIEKTAQNAGELEIVQHPPRRNRTRLLLLMDVGGSMDPYARLVEQLFTAASRTGRFARFRHYYFHNTIYDFVYEDAFFEKKVPFADLIHGSERRERLVLVGDAAMHPAELLSPGGYGWYSEGGRTASIDRMRNLASHFRRTAWLNPTADYEWQQTTVKTLRALFPMFPLTVEGIQGAVRQLLRGGAPIAA
ncbi:MAG: VWA domain-containing protein [Deltaproteobacteria bacterium]|nr:VWA domain-containing protein [Deltaproteobacteria bacterium]